LNAPPTTLSEAVIPPILPGAWQGVQSHRRPLAYDVPIDWTVLGSGLLTGFEWDDPSLPSGGDQVIFSGTAEGAHRTVECHDFPDPTAAIGSNGGETDSTDTASIAAINAGRWAAGAFASAEGVLAEYTLSAATPLTAAGGLSGHLVRADVTMPCGPGAAVVWVFSFPAPDLTGVYNVIIYADGGPAGTPEKLAVTMLQTVRHSPVPAS